MKDRKEADLMLFLQKNSAWKEEASMKEVPLWEKTNLTLEEAAAYSNIGVNKLREISSG